MAIGARAKLSLQQGREQGSGKCLTLGPRRMICITLLGILLFRLVFSQALEYYRSTIQTIEHESQLTKFEFGVSGGNSTETIWRYSQFNPALVTERERIKFFLKATNFGQISVKQIMYPKNLRTMPAKRNLRTHRVKVRSERAWMLPFASKYLEPFIPDAVKLSKTWLGDKGDFNPQVMQDLLQVVKGPLDQNAAYWSRTLGLNDEDVSWGKKYRSCAVVGNSGILLNGSYGQQIDSHDMVIRLNNARIQPFTEHVGSKTNLSFINSNILHSCSVIPECWCHPYGKEVPIVLYICQAVHLVYVARCKSHHKSPVVVTPSFFDSLCAAIVKWYSVTNFVQRTGRPVSEWDSVHGVDYFHYSSGMQAVVLALGICDTVDMFGFGKSPHSKHHYHTQQTEELSLHDYVAEYLFYDDLVHNRTIPFLSDAGISVPPVRIFL